MVLKKKETGALRALKEEIGKRYSILDFRVFGSKARGDDSPYSDIDVMIKLPELPPAIESEIYDLVFDINLKYDCFISLTIFTSHEIEEGPMSESPIFKTIMKEGVAV